MPNPSGNKIIVVGDLMVDRYLEGDASRISPEAPVLVLQKPKMHDRLGGAANVAANIKSLGEECILFSLVGDDLIANNLRRLLSDADIEFNLSIDKERDTTLKLRVVSRGHQFVRVDYESKNPFTHDKRWYEALFSQVSNAKALILSDYSKGCLTNCEEIIKHCRLASVPVIVDPKGENYSKYAGATLVTPNEKELIGLFGKTYSEKELNKKVFKLIKELNFGGILLTRSEKGMTYYSNNTVRNISSNAKEVIDVTGAGDTVVAAFTTFLSRNYSIEKAIELANIAAGIVVGKARTSTVTSDEVQIAAEKIRDSKILNDEKLKKTLRLWKENGEKIVMTNGCFDILHAGHTDFLKKAKNLGTKLVVAVNSDKSVQKIKGINRPINDEMQRSEVLSSLSCVDAVVLFHEETPEQFYNKNIPDVLVKGGDYSESEIVGSDVTINSGGYVKTIPFRYKTSTTNIIMKILKND